jgi:hypothetical protein
MHVQLGGLYIWTHTHGIIKRSGEIYRKMREPIVGISAVTSVVVEPNHDDDSVKSEEYNTISPSSKPADEKGQHQIVIFCFRPLSITLLLHTRP